MALPSPTSPKVLLQAPAFGCAIIGFILLWIALGTPAWQVTYAVELRQWLQSGLWLNCQTRPNGMYQCTWMFSQSDFDFYSNPDLTMYRTPTFYHWQRTLLHLFLAVQATVLVALVSFCVSNTHTMQRCAVITFTIAIGIATVASFLLLCSFFVISYMVEYRFYTVSVSGIYEKHRGYSFFIAIVAAFFYLASSVFAAIYLIRYSIYVQPSGGLQRMAKGYTPSTLNTYNSREDYRMTTSHDDFQPTFSFQPSYRSSHQFSTTDDYAMKPLPPTPRSYQLY